MQEKEFLSLVQERGPDADLVTTREATKATIEVLSYYLPTEEAQRMAAQLPGELKAAGHVGGVDFLSGEGVNNVDAFYGLVANRANLDIDVAIAYTHAVLAVVQKAINDGEIAGVTLSLPTSLSDIWKDI